VRAEFAQLAANARTFQLGIPFDPAGEMLRCQELSVEVLSGEALHANVRMIPDAPQLLYLRGRAPQSVRALAIVGTRTPTPSGRRAARCLGRECAQKGIVVVSGLARGIDAEAHQGALEGGGVTWAVLGSGLGRIYPPEHAVLAEAIVESGGALLSEAPTFAPPARAHFPRRNRIVAGLATGVVVIEGGIKSGSMITARLAAEQGRTVFAFPGLAGAPMSAAPHRLIREGAVLAENLSDIMQELPVLRALPSL
jgi:DNA processing protein